VPLSQTTTFLLSILESGAPLLLCRSCFPRLITPHFLNQRCVQMQRRNSVNLFSVVVNSIKAFVATTIVKKKKNVATTIWIIKSKYIQARRERLNRRYASSCYCDLFGCCGE
jgi:hypothetical protein